LGIARALVLTGLALVSASKERRTVRPELRAGSSVSVLIPAYNEERVIERSIRQVLGSEKLEVEVIVIDDGSKDRTSAAISDLICKVSARNCTSAI